MQPGLGLKQQDRHVPSFPGIAMAPHPVPEHAAPKPLTLSPPRLPVASSSCSSMRLTQLSAHSSAKLPSMLCSRAQACEAEALAVRAVQQGSTGCWRSGGAGGSRALQKAEKLLAERCWARRPDASLTSSLFLFGTTTATRQLS